MWIKGKSRLWMGLIAIHLCKMIIIVWTLITIQHGSWYYGFYVESWYLALLIGDSIVFFCYLVSKPLWEEGSRILGFFWNILCVATMFSIASVNFEVLGICIIENCILAWPKPFGPSLDEIHPSREDMGLIRISCYHCSAIYSYRKELQNDEGILCQNCGKSVYK